MGEMAAMMIDGTMCQECGTYISEGDGYPRYCESCASDDSNNGISRSEFVPKFKRIMRQLQQRQCAINKGLRKDQHYQNKRYKFIELIDGAILNGWFKMPKKGTRIWKVYHDEWD